MKKIKILTLAGLMLLGFNSCKKKIYGCMDESAENYSPVATQDGKDCVYKPQEEVIVSNVFNNVVFYQISNYWKGTINWSEITQDVLNNGAVSVFLGGGNEWIQLPVTLPDGSGLYNTISINPSYHLGGVDIEIENSDGITPNNPNGLFNFKVVILK